MSSSRVLEIELYDTQYDFVTCDDRFTAFVAGIGSGKTFGGAAKGCLLAEPGTLGALVPDRLRSPLSVADLVADLDQIDSTADLQLSLIHI